MSKLDQIPKRAVESQSSANVTPISIPAQTKQNNESPLFPVRIAMLVGIVTIAMLKTQLIILGVMDIIVGIYGLIVVSLLFFAFYLAYAKYRDPGKNDRQHHHPLFEPSVSIIIPIYNEQGLIKETVESCLTTTYPADKLQVILVNDGSTDDTALRLDTLRREHPSQVKVVHLTENMGKRKAIREGIVQGEASGDIIVLVDSDSTMDRYALEQLVAAFADAEIGAAAGHGKVRNAEFNTLTKIQDTWYDGQFSILKGMESSLDSVSCCSGILAAYRREAIMPCLDHWCNDKFLGAEFRPGDDRHLTSYVLGGARHYIGKQHKTWKVKYVASAMTYTEVPSTFRQFLKQQTRWKKSWVRMFCFNLPFYFQDRPRLATYIYYMQTMLSFISPIVAFRSLVWLPLEGNFVNAAVYLSGIFFVGTLFAVEFKLRNPDSGSRWLYRMLMPFLSIAVLNNLMYYALLTIRKGSWLTR